jgi:formate hydrogenlyase subunit 6/NADH:ubiquinone oxidoreductase subunit I
MTTGSSVFSSVGSYLAGVARGARSVVRSCSAALPYLLNVRSGDLRKEITEQYPDPVSSRTADDLPPRTRGLLTNDIERCTGCRECERVCPTRCIYVETEEIEEGSKTWISTFDIDHSKCIFCGLCVEVCLPQSLVHTRAFERAVEDPGQLVASFGKGVVTEEQRARWRALRQSQDELEEFQP